MSFAARQAAWAEAFLAALVEAGVRRAVASPGSRSTPLVLALARLEEEGRVRVRVAQDERAAAFLALGASRATGDPVLLVCTSGTAGAHWLPALIEASAAGAPLVALTADRPPELQGRGANQTIEQRGLFGRHVRGEWDLGVPDADERAWEGMLRTAGLAVQRALAPDPGPVHVNARFRKPLEPAPEDADEIARLRVRTRARLDGGLPRPSRPRLLPDPLALDDLEARLRGARRGLLLAGPADRAGALVAGAVARLARAGWLAVAPEAASGLRFARGLEDVPVCDGLEPALAAGELPVDGEPDFVLQIGGAPTGRATLAWLAARPRLDRAVIGAHHVPEAVNRASTVIPGDPGLVLAELTARLEADPPDSPADEWPAPLLAASDRAWRRLQSVLGDASGAGSAALSEPAAVRLAVGAVPDGGLLVLSNSLPVRETDLFVRAAPLGVEVLSQRGASGIDGIVAGAAGAADATGRPTVLLVGDVAFLHDLTGLAAARGVGAPLAVVVLANGGGRIFELLPVRGLSGIEPVFRRYFLTPPEVDAVAAAASLGVPGVVASTADELGGALADALTRRGPTVVEARVEPGSAVDAIRALDRSSASTDT